MLKLAFAALMLATGTAAAQVDVPPARYDRPYQGDLSIKRVPLGQIYQACDAMYARLQIPGGLPSRLAGCAAVAQDLSWCEVTIPRRAERVMGRDGKPLLLRPEDVLRHEVGHCNGWEHE